MPPSVEGGPDYSSAWDAATEILKSLGFEVPSYKRQGCLFTINSQGVVDIYPMSQLTIIKMLRFRKISRRIAENQRVAVD
jgi:hypothetical protein